MRQVHRIMAADAPNGDEDLVMMRIIGDTRERKPCCHFLVPEGATNDLHACFKTVLLLGKVIQKGFPVGLLNVLSHRVSSGILAPGETVMCVSERGFSSITPAPWTSAESIEQVLCQFFDCPHTAWLWRIGSPPSGGQGARPQDGLRQCRWLFHPAGGVSVYPLQRLLAVYHHGERGGWSPGRPRCPRCAHGTRQDVP